MCTTSSELLIALQKKYHHKAKRDSIGNQTGVWLSEQEKIKQSARAD
jgi:hypothetical protein